jgi:hypothetical protein
MIPAHQASHGVHLWHSVRMRRIIVLIGVGLAACVGNLRHAKWAIALAVDEMNKVAIERSF